MNATAGCCGCRCWSGGGYFALPFEPSRWGLVASPVLAGCHHSARTLGRKDVGSGVKGKRIVSISTIEFETAVGVWKQAAQELDIEIVTPFTFQVENREHLCLAWLPHFCSPRRGVVVGIMDVQQPGFTADATISGYLTSLVEFSSYAALFNRQLIIDTLADWGYFGPEDRKPSWYKGMIPWGH